MRIMNFLKQNKKLNFTFIWLFIIFSFILVFFKKNSYANFEISETNSEVFRKAIIETANAFYRKGKYIQYDGYRKTYLSTPEEATSQNTIFTVCSGFTYQVYYQALGIDIPKLTDDLINYAKELNSKTNKQNLIYYNDNLEEINSLLAGVKHGTNSFMKELTNKILPGDMVVIIRKLESGSTEGHVVMINKIENDTISFIHSSGSTYSIGTNNTDDNIDVYEANGSIKLGESLKDYLISQYDKTGFDISKLAVIRIITDNLEYSNPKNLSKKIKISEITESAVSRLKYPGIDIDKQGYASLNSKNNMIVQLGDTIEYKITITNNGDTVYKNLKIKEKLSEHVTFQQEKSETNVNFDKNSFIWTIKELLPNKSTTIIYKVKVKNDISYLKTDTYITSSGKVDEIDTNEIIHKVGINLENSEKTELINAFNKLKSTTTVKDLEFIVKVYEEAGLDNMALELKKLYNGETKKYKTAQDLVTITNDKCLNSNDSTSTSGFYCSYKIDNSISNILLNNYYGVRIGRVTQNNFNVNVVRGTLAWDYYLKKNSIYERARFITEETLEIGDVIIIYGGVLENMYDTVYLYTAPGEFVRKFKDSYSVYTLNGTTRYYKDKTISSKSVSITYLRAAIGDNYVILRPSLINYKEVESIKIKSVKNNIKVSEQLNLDVTITPSNYTNKNITWSSSNLEVATVINGKVTAKKVGTSIISATVEKLNGEIIKDNYTIKVEENKNDKENSNKEDTNLDNNMKDENLNDNQESEKNEEVNDNQESEKNEEVNDSQEIEKDISNNSSKLYIYYFVFSIILFVFTVLITKKQQTKKVD